MRNPTRNDLRRFWRRLLNDLEYGRPISDERASLAYRYACSWHT